MRVQQTRPLNPVPDYTNIKDEATRQWCKDLADSLLKTHRNISDDISNMQNLDAVDSLPAATKEYQGRMVLLKGSGTGADTLYVGIGTGSGGYAFKEMSL